jgi:hypothetical protein
MLNKKELQMRKVTKTHAVAINKLMLPLINTVAYIDEDENDFSMYKDCVFKFPIQRRWLLDVRIWEAMN